MRLRYLVAPLILSALPFQVRADEPAAEPNVQMHIVQPRRASLSGRHELGLYPAVAQINPRFTSHLGVAASYSYHLYENLSLQVTPLYHYLGRESAFNQELIDKGHLQAQAASALLLQAGLLGGVEIAPVYGKFTLADRLLGHFSLVVSAGAGVGTTRIQLWSQRDECTDAASCRPSSFGDTGLKFLGSIGAGMRVLLAERFLMRLEVRDVVFTARVDEINGCGVEDLENIERGHPPGTQCRPGDFAHDDDRHTALGRLQETSSDVLNQVLVFAGVGFLF